MNSKRPCVAFLMLFGPLLLASCARKASVTLQQMSLHAVEKLAQQGHANAESELARREAAGIGTNKNENLAAKWYREAFAQGYAPAANALGLLYEHGHDAAHGDELPQSYKKAVEWFRKAAARGYAPAENTLGLLYRDGPYDAGSWQLPQSYKQAAVWFRRAAAQRNAAADNNLGMLYAYGEGVPQNQKIAIMWLTKGATQGSPAAQNNLGLFYYGKTSGLGSKSAETWVSKAAAQGYAPAERNLGVMYEYGQGVLKNKRTAATWFRKAANQGYGGFYGLVSPSSLGVQIGYIEKAHDLTPYRLYKRTATRPETRIYKLPDGCRFGVEVDSNGNVSEIGADLEPAGKCTVSPVNTYSALIWSPPTLQGWTISDLVRGLHSFELKVSLLTPADLIWPSFTHLIEQGATVNNDVSYMWSFDGVNVGYSGKYASWRQKVINRVQNEDPDSNAGSVCLNSHGKSPPGSYLKKASDLRPEFLYIGHTASDGNCDKGGVRSFMDFLNLE